MDLLLVRHAIAVRRGSLPTDAERPLTPQGRDRFRRSVAGLAALGIVTEVVLHSPWTRAAQTAQLMAPLTARGSKVTDELAGPPDERLLDAIAAERAASVALVGHEPWLSELASLLLAGSTEAMRLELKKGSVARLEGAPVPGGMILRALLPPRVTRRTC